MMPGFRLKSAAGSVKLLITVFLLVLALGYITAVALIYDNTHITYKGIVQYYRGVPEEMIYPIEFRELLETTHIHLFSMSFLFFLLDAIFLLTDLSERLKKVIVITPFILIVLDMSSLWLTRYVAAQFAGLTLFAGIMMALTFLVLFLVPLYEIWVKKE